MRPVFEKVKFVVRRSLRPFKDLDDHFDPSSTAVIERSATVHVFHAFLVIVIETFMAAKGLSLGYR